MRQHFLLWGALVLGVGVAIACSGSSSDDTATSDGGMTTEGGDLGVTDDGGSTGPQGPAGSGLATGLPCDVQAIIENRCIACHDGSMAPSAPPMLTYADLVAMSKVDPTKTIAEEAVVRLKSTTSPMPPPPAVPPDQDEIDTFTAWVMAGAPKNPMSCTDPPPPVPEGGVDAGPLPEGGEAGACTSGQYWDGGNTKSALMNPGEACNACHSKLGGPNLAFAGTIYTFPHEPDLCDGKGPPPTLTVTITDKNAQTQKIITNAAGNFQIPKAGKPLRAPFKASISDGTKTRAMVGSVTSGDCNTCHTVAGLNGAPGRILAP